MSFSGYFLSLADSALNVVNHKSSVSIFSGAALSVSIWIIGEKLKGFSKPQWPLRSVLIRTVGKYSYKIGFITMVITIAYFTLILLLVEIGYFFLSFSEDISFADAFVAGVHEFLKVSSFGLVKIFWGYGVGVVISYMLTLIVIPRVELGQGLHDINKMIAGFSKLKTFDPVDYFKLEQGCFIGLDKKSPIYIPWRKIKETHIQVLGATGTGKGVVMSLIAIQAVLSGEGLIWLDPKFDRYSPRLLKHAAKHVGKKYHFINLNPDQPPQFNLLAGASPSEIEELFVAGFELISIGTDGDFHKGKDEDAAVRVSKIAAEHESISLPELINLCLLDQSITDQENFWRKLNKLGDLAVINTNSGINLPQAIKDGDVIYIVGSTDNQRVKMLQKMLLVRINQIIKSQDRLNRSFNTCLVLDEFKYLLSPIALSSLGVISDFNTHCILAHQSLGDLDCCAGISRAEAEGVVLDNTAIKIIYKLGDSEYAEKLSKNSGKKAVYLAHASKKIDEVTPSEGSWIESPTALIDLDVFTHLPIPVDGKNQASVGVLFGHGLAKIFHVGHISVAGDLPLPIAAEKIDIIKPEEDLI